MEELASDRKTQQDFQSKAQQKISQLETQLKQAQIECSNKSIISKANNINESFIDRKIEKHVDQNLQHKLDVLYDEKYRQLGEIEKLNTEIKSLKLQLETQKEKLTKENKKLNKEQIQKLEKTISKQTTEIAKLKENLDESQDTITFLTQQVNNLNQQIFELNTKENDFELIENANSKPKLTQQLNKKLLDSSLSTDYSLNAGASSSNRHLASVDLNSSTNKATKLNFDSDESMRSTPKDANRPPEN